MKDLKIKGVWGFLLWMIAGISNLSATPPSSSFYEEGTRTFYLQESLPDSESLAEVKILRIHGYPKKKICSNSSLVPSGPMILLPLHYKGFCPRKNSVTDLRYHLKKKFFPFHLFW